MASNKKLKDLLGKLSSISQNDNISIFIPSQQRQVSFSPLTVKQQKDIFRSFLDRGLGAITMPLTFNEIMEQNCSEKDILFETIDRDYVMFCLRVGSLGTTAKRLKDGINLQDLSEEEIRKQAGEHFIEYDVGQFVVSPTFEEPTEQQIIVSPDITIDLHIPPLKKDTRFLEYSKKKFAKLINEEDGISEAISDLYVIELAKHVNRVVFQEEEEIVYSFDTLSVEDCVQLVSSLPSKVNKELSLFVEKIRNFERENLTLEDGHSVTLDALFFSFTN